MQGKLYKKEWDDVMKSWDCRVCVECGGMKFHLSTYTWFPENLSTDKRNTWGLNKCDETCTAKTVTLPPWVEKLVKNMVKE